MAIVTLRLNEEEAKVLDLLVKYFDADKSKVLKEAMWDKYEDLRDQEIVEEFEKKDRSGKAKFESGDALIQAISQKKKPKK